MPTIQSGSRPGITAAGNHFAVVFIRYDASGKEISRFPSLYAVTLLKSHWGVQARSGFAP